MRQERRTRRSVGHSYFPQLVHAAIDLDAVALTHLPGGRAADELMYENLASLERSQDRVRHRELGINRQSYVDRVTYLTQKLDEAALEDFRVTNEGRGITEVATEMLVKAGWISN